MSLLSCRAKALMCSAYQFLQFLLGSKEVDTKRLPMPKIIENRAVSPSENASGTVQATQNGGRAALFDRKKRARSARRASENFFVGANVAISAEKANASGPTRAGPIDFGRTF